MAVHLHCDNGKGTSKDVEVRPGKGARITCRDQDGAKVELQFQIEQGACFLAVHGDGKVTCNGQPVKRLRVCAGDAIEVGAFVFTAVGGDELDDLGTMPLDDYVSASVDLGPGDCSSCHTAFDADDRRDGWRDGAFRLCRRCLGKGVQPQHLTGWRHSLDVEIEQAGSGGGASTELQPHLAVPGSGAIEPMDMQQILDAEAFSGSDRLPTQAYGHASSGSSELVPDDQPTRAYGQPDPAPDDEPETAPVDLRTPSGPLRSRSSRRISASRISQVEDDSAGDEPKGGFLSRVSKVFRRRSESGDPGQQRLGALEEERFELLVEMGRRVLVEDAGIGLAHEVLADLADGQRVDLSPADLNRPAFDHWRSERRRLATLDAEISALRQRLGMGSDPAIRLSQVKLRTERQDQEDRAFLAMDALNTEDLGHYADEGDSGETAGYERAAAGETEPAEAVEGESPRDVPPSPRRSGRRNQVRRRRR